MFFHIEHTTEYAYSAPATESFSELRLRPRDSLRQKVSRHSTHIQPAVAVESYVDYFGNFVETISVPFRHTKLAVTSICDVITHPHADALSVLDLTLSESRLLYARKRRELYDFLRPSHFIRFTPEIHEMARELLPPTASFAQAMFGLNTYIYKNFKYQPGVTDARTSVPEFLKKRKGVCQDFAHLMIALCRTVGIPARYVSGYIESELIPYDHDAPPDPALIGAAASHAWVEIYSPNHFWVGLDPTNNMLESERHVQIGIGRDYHDVPPLQGIFQGRRQQSLSVQVRVMRTEVIPETPIDSLEE
jgi:transglutaminase-like putative cysteine protease